MKTKKINQTNLAVAKEEIKVAQAARAARYQFKKSVKKSVKKSKKSKKSV